MVSVDAGNVEGRPGRSVPKQIGQVSVAGLEGLFDGALY